MMLAATGVLRGLQDTRTPLVAAVAANVLNIVLDLALVYGAGLGIAGSAIGSVIAQVLAAGMLTYVVVRAARSQDVPLRPDMPGIRASARAGVALVVRTLTLRMALLVTTYAVTHLGRRRPGRRAGHSPDRDSRCGRSWRSCSMRSRSPRRR